MAETSRIIRGSIEASMAVLDLSITLTATSVLSSKQRPRYTLAKLPRPNRRTNWYFPRMIDPDPLPSELVVLLILTVNGGGWGCFTSIPTTTTTVAAAAGDGREGKLQKISDRGKKKMGVKVQFYSENYLVVSNLSIF